MGHRRVVYRLEGVSCWFERREKYRIYYVDVAAVRWTDDRKCITSVSADRGIVFVSKRLSTILADGWLVLPYVLARAIEFYNVITNVTSIGYRSNGRGHGPSAGSRCHALANAQHCAVAYDLQHRTSKDSRISIRLDIVYLSLLLYLFGLMPWRQKRMTDDTT